MSRTALVHLLQRCSAVLLLAGCASVPTPSEPPKRNVILFIGDGMGVSTVTAARILAGQRSGQPGEENSLSFESFPNVALIKTYNTNAQVPDSAGTMTAIVTGEKTRIGVLSVAADVKRGDCETALARPLVTLLELAEERGLATGVVTTTRLTHATPAATYAHVPHRDWESDTELPRAATEQGCRDIARQLVEFDRGDGIEVAMGGGRTRFLPSTAVDPEYPSERGMRGDGRDLAAEWVAAGAERHYVWIARAAGSDFVRYLASTCGTSSSASSI